MGRERYTERWCGQGGERRTEMRQECRERERDKVKEAATLKMRTEMVTARYIERG